MSVAVRRYRTADPEHPFVFVSDETYLDQWSVLVNAACEGVAKVSLANIGRWVVDFLRHCYKSPEGRSIIAMNCKRSAAQPVLRAFFADKGYTLEFKDSEGGFIVSRADNRLSDVEQGIRVLKRIFSLMWPLLGRMKKNPMKVGKRQQAYRDARSRRILADSAGFKPKRARPRRARQGPDDGLFRVKHPRKGKWAGPKPLAPNLRDTLAQAAADDGWPVELRMEQMIEAAAGSRRNEAANRTFADWWGSKYGNVLRSTNKGSGDDRVKDLDLNDPRVRRLRNYVNVERLLRSPGKDMAYWRRVGERADAGCQKAIDELDTPILLGPRGKPYSYRTKARHVERSMERRGIRNRGHAQRHEHTTERFDEIDAMPITEEAKVLLLREHGEKKHWADFDAMYLVYAGDAVRRRRTRVEVAFQDKRDKGMLATQQRRPDEVDMPEGDILAGTPVPKHFADAMPGMAPC